MKNQKRSPTFNYSNYRSVLLLFRQKQQEGFTLIELIVTVFILGVLASMSLPIYLKQVEKARTSEAIYTLGAINKAQQAYRWETSNFANNMDELGLNMSSPKFYSFSWTGTTTPNEVRHMAIPVAPYDIDLRTYTSGVFRENDAFYSVVCAGTDVGDVPSLTNKTTCANGTILGQ